MKKLLLPLYLFASSAVFGQENSSNTLHKIPTYFEEVKKATKKNSKIWNKDIYGGILLVNPNTREVYSNVPDAKNSLSKQQNIYIGILPDTVNIANTALRWNGQPYAMIMLPLADNVQDRVNLLTHELFHTAQSALGFSQNNKESNHLDQKEGRIYLRLELEALKKAILADSKKEQQEHLSHALIFRKYRNSLYPNSANVENQLELNEGIAEYTGLMMSGRTKNQVKEHVVKSTNAFFKNPTYVRSFAYYTTPIYGYLLSQQQKYWNHPIHGNTDLTTVFVNGFGVTMPNNLQEVVEKITNTYNGETIFAEEILRAEKIQQEIAAYKNKFIEQPHFVLKFEKMNVSFDPRNIVPIEDVGTVYPTIRVTDNWGILEVNNGALMSKNWDKISISSPVTITDQKVEGDGWILTLNANYTLHKEEETNNYRLVKK